MNSLLTTTFPQAPAALQEAREYCPASGIAASASLRHLNHERRRFQ